MVQVGHHDRVEGGRVGGRAEGQLQAARRVAGAGLETVALQQEAVQ